MLRYIGRPEAASPAEGKAATHLLEQARIVAEAYANVAPVLTSPAHGSAPTNGKNGTYKNGTAKAAQPITELTEQRTEAQTDAH